MFQDSPQLIKLTTSDSEIQSASNANHETSLLLELLDTNINSKFSVSQWTVAALMNCSKVTLIELKCLSEVFKKVCENTTTILPVATLERKLRQGKDRA